MKPLYAASLRTIVLCLISLGVLFPVGLIAYSATLFSQQQNREAHFQLQSASSRFFEEQQRNISSLEQLAITMAELPAIQTRRVAEAEHLLANLVAANPALFTIMLADRNGDVWASARPLAIPASVAGQRCFVNALATGMFSSGEYVVMSPSRKPVLNFAYPLKNKAGNVNGVIYLSMSLTNVYERIFDNGFRSANMLLLTDHKGSVLYSSLDRNAIGKMDTPALFAAMKAQSTGKIFEMQEQTGTHSIISARAVRLKHEETPCLYLRVTLDRSVVMRSIYSALGYMLLSFSCALLLVCSLVWYFGKKGILDAFEGLREVARKFSLVDDTQQDSGAVSGNELSGLVRTFDDMANKLATTITKVQQSDLALKESEQNYRELVEKAQTIIIKMDKHGNVTFFNTFAELFFGFSEQELLGRSVIGSIVPETESSGRNLQEMIEKLVKNPALFANNINENMKKNGERIWVSWNNHQLVDANGTMQGVLCIGQDITERKKIDEQLRASEQRFRSYVENANDVIFSLTPEGIFSYVSPQWKAAFGYEIEETIGKPFVPFVHPDDVAVCFEFLTKVMQSDKKQADVEYRVRHKNGTWLWYTANGSRIVEQDNSLTFIGIGRNITEQKLIQNELIKAQKLESLSILAAGIAHNFNNALTGVIGYISFSRKHLNEPEKIAPLLDAAEKSSNRAASLARQLLTFSKGGVPFKKLHSPKELVQESLSLFLSGTKVKGDLYCNSGQMIFVDSQQVNQAFNNIVLNALHAMPQGGTLDVRITNQRLEPDNVHLLKQGEYVMIAFEDCGCGIAPEHLDKVFDPYFTTRPTGSGLGLSTTHSIIAKHGGHVGITSQQGRGTTVTVLLPAFQDIPSARQVEQQSRESVESSGASILFMDDEMDIRELATERLNEAGYHVTTCRSGEEVVAQYRECWKKGASLPVVILDLLIPGGVGGDEAARQIRSIDPMARLIVSSGYSNDPVMAEYQKYGFCDVLPKPYSTETLLQVIQRVMAPSGKVE